MYIVELLGSDIIIMALLLLTSTKFLQNMAAYIGNIAEKRCTCTICERLCRSYRRY